MNQTGSVSSIKSGWEEEAERLEKQDEERADYEVGFQAQLDGEPCSAEATPGWKRGWDAAKSDD